MRMLDGLEIDLEFLNRATLAWVEQEYHNAVHDEIGCTPLEAMLNGPSVSRRGPEPAMLRFRFSVRDTRIQRRTDGTVSIDGVRFELPSRLRHLRQVHVRYRRWDYSIAWVIDPATDEILSSIKPLDKRANSDGLRRALPAGSVEHTDIEPTQLPPLMRKIMREFAATGLPAPYIPYDPEQDHD